MHDEKLKIEIRFSTATDAKMLSEMLINDDSAAGKLGITGGSFTDIAKNDFWETAFVAEVRGKFAGFVKIEIHASGQTLRIEKLYVVKKYRQKDIAERLLTFAEQFGYKNWSFRAYDALTIENPVMESFLLRKGYKNMGTYRNFTYRDGKFYDQTYWQKEL